MRNTIITLLKNQAIQSCISTSTDYEEDTENSFIENFLEDPESISNKIVNGDYDNTEWEIDLRVLNLGSEELLPLSHLEYGALKALGENFLSIKRGSIYEKKENSTPISIAIQKNIETIQDAISDKQAVTFVYKKQNNETKQVTLFPYQLITNVSDNWIYLQSTEGKLYRLDRFQHPCKIVKGAGEYPDFTPNPNQKYVWGAYFKKDLTPTHVKLRIADETTNIIKKIQRDIYLRSETCKFYQEGDFYYYEDDIVGMDEFQRWVRSYGSSIIVLEPKSLQDSIISRAHETLDNYKLAESWSDL